MSSASTGHRVQRVSFAQSSENTLGVGKLLGVERDRARIEYFSSPCLEPSVAVVECDRVLTTLRAPAETPVGE